MNYFNEHPTNIAARASNGPERSKWRACEVDPELVANPFDTAIAAEQRRVAAEQESARIKVGERCESLGFAVGQLVSQKVLES